MDVVYMDNERLSKGELLQLYICYKDIEKYLLNKQDEYLKLYLTNSTLIIAAWAYVIFEKNTDNIFLLKPFLLMALTILLFFISLWFSKAKKKVFYNTMQIVAQTAKIEDLLKLHKKELYGGNLYWKEEGVIPIKHLDFRVKSENMSGFVENYFNLKGTLYHIFGRVQWILWIINAIMFIYSVLLFSKLV